MMPLDLPPALLTALFALVASAFACGMLLVTARYHCRYTADPLDGVQKLHREPTPRVGGIAIYLSMLLAYGVAGMYSLDAMPLLKVMLIAGLPVWFIGLAEDLSKRVGAIWRLVATLVSGLVASLLTGMRLTDLGIPGIDHLLQFVPLSLVFTAFALAGVTNAVNLIDGMNGLAGGFACVALTAFGAIALTQGDMALAQLCLWLSAATLGFLLLNWPRGRIFLGDGGCYFLGAAVAWVGVELTQRYANVSAFTALLICMHPVMETVFSLFRRWVRGRSYAQADRLHLHSLLLRRVVRQSDSLLNRALRAVLGCDLSQMAPWVSNAACGLLVAGLSVPAGVLAYWWYDVHLVLVAICLVFALGYVTMYARLVRFHWCSPIHFLLGSLLRERLARAPA